MNRKTTPFLLILIITFFILTNNAQAHSNNLFYIMDDQNNILLATQQKITRGDRYWTGETWYEVTRVSGNIAHAITIEDPEITAAKARTRTRVLMFIILLASGLFFYLRAKGRLPLRRKRLG